MNRNEPFAAFCNRLAAHVNVKIPDGDYTLPEEYNTKATNLLNNLKQKKKGFPYYPITFIQSRFDNLDEVKETLTAKTTDGEIPNWIPTYFAYNLYSTFEYDDDGNLKPDGLCGYNNLPESLQNIIKVVSVYFMLQI